MTCRFGITIENKASVRVTQVEYAVTIKEIQRLADDTVCCEKFCTSMSKNVLINRRPPLPNG
jgi:hypothetical protein